MKGASQSSKHLLLVSYSVFVPPFTPSVLQHIYNMADDPVPNPMPYLDPQNLAFLQSAGKLLNGKQLTDLSLRDLRAFVDELETPEPNHPDISVSSLQIKTSHGEVKTFVYKPKDASGDLPFVYYLHGGAWILGNAFVYSGFVFDLIERATLEHAVVFPQYTLAPDEKFPVQQEQCLEVMQWLTKHGSTYGLATDKVAVMADSAGGMSTVPGRSRVFPPLPLTSRAGQLAAAVSILNHQRNLKLPITHQILFDPLLDSTVLGTRFSEFKFQNGPFYGTSFIQEAITDYFADQDSANTEQRASITASPLIMTQQQAQEFMPPTTIVTSQADWLRDQGQDFAQLLQTAGVACGVVQGVAILHIAEVWNGTRTSPTVELIMMMVAAKLRQVFLPAFCSEGASKHMSRSDEAFKEKATTHAPKRKRRS